MNDCSLSVACPRCKRPVLLDNTRSIRAGLKAAVSLQHARFGIAWSCRQCRLNFLLHTSEPASKNEPTQER